MTLPEDPVFGTWYYLSFKIIFFEGSTRYQMQLQNFSKNFYSSNILNSPLGPVLNPKSTTFSHLVPIQRPKKSKKKFKKCLFLVFVPVQIPYLWTQNFLKNFGAAFGTWYYLQKNIF